MRLLLGSCVLAGYLAAAATGHGQSSGQAAATSSAMGQAVTGQAVPSSSVPASSAPAATAPAANAGAAQDAAAPANSKKNKKKDVVPVTTGGPVKAGSLRDERKAAKLYVDGVRLMEKQRFDEAWKQLQQAVALEPENATYLRAADLARASAVTQLVQEASKARARGADADAAGLMDRAKDIDPENPIVAQHVNALVDAATSQVSGASVGASINEAGAKDSETQSAVVLEPRKEKHSFHLRTGSREVLTQVFKAYGVTAMLHESVQNKQVRLDVDDVDFADAARVLGMVTKTFYEPLDPHRVVVAQDTRENRTQLERTEMETIYLPGLNDKALTEVSNVAHNVFEVQQAALEPAHGTITVRAPVKTLAAFNRTIDGLESGQNQIDLNIKVIQLARISARETGTTFLQQTGVYNAYSEINSIIQQNQSAVQQIISQGLVPNASTITNQIEIIAILLAAGQLSGTVFNQGFALFGGGITTSLLQPGSATLTMSLNSSDTRTLDDIHLRLSDEEAGTFKIGERYPIETSSYSSVALPTTSALSTSSALTTQTVPQIQYEDLGLTMKATPKVMRSDDVALTLELKIESLGGTSLNDIPILNSQQIAGVLTIKAGETAILLSDLSRQESRALSGLPGVSDIPGLQDISDIARNQNVARLLILVTPSVIRGPRAAGHGPRMLVDKGSAAH
jgi:type II secretory pathway component GspD/PulD (secretin)